jgi:hypothetical protein
MPLILEAPDGRQRLELSILGYQSPDPWHPEYRLRSDRVPRKVTPHETDWNWLRIHIEARTADTAWSAEGAALLTWEVEWLADWLEALAWRRRTDSGREFVDPLLAFRAAILSDELVHLRIQFGIGLYPLSRWSRAERHRPPAHDSDVFVEFDLDSSQLYAASRALRAELSRYPARTPTPADRL